MIYSKKLSSLVKVFKKETPVSHPECGYLTALKGDSISFQVTYFSDKDLVANVKIESELEKYITVRSVEYVPARVAVNCLKRDVILKDGNYIKTDKAEFPDYLRKLKASKLKIKKNIYRTLWIEAELPQKIKAGDYDIKVTLVSESGDTLSEEIQRLTVCNASLPEATLIHTEWFHTDCIADYYGYEVFSEKHWSAIKNFMKTAVKRGINMIFTPVFTPPLDTAVGGERTTVQLVDVNCDSGAWSFGFEKLSRWVDLALSVGYKYFEISHLFTQWGAKAAPKIMATVDGEYKRVFGWDTPVSDGRYPEFLSKFLPELTAFLKKRGIAENTYFHVSDEPNASQMESYTLAKNTVKPFIEGFHSMDALSSYEFYETGLVETPVPGTNHIVPFIENNVSPLWSYYCVTQQNKYSNRYMMMSLARTRAIGVQWFKYNVKGFLHWGYNFYNSRHSVLHINPYKETEANAEFPAGDSFVIYPGAGGKPEESIRLIAFHQAQTDLRALTALAEKTSYEHVMELIEGDLGEPITFECFPLSEYYYINLRNKVNLELNKY